MKQWSVSRLLPLLLCVAPLAASAQVPPREVVLWFPMSVDAQGRPTSVDVPPELPPSIGESVSEWARGLRFVPASVDGVPQASTTTLRIRFDTTDPQAAKIAHANTGPGLAVGEMPPPPDNDGAGYFLVEFDASGAVTRVSLDEAHSPMSSKKFTRWATRYMSDFRFTPETVGGQPVAGRVRIPLQYCHLRRKCLVELPPLPGVGQVASGEMIPESVLARKEGAR